jgi:dTDP-4-dehydrorhamnose reductase
MRRRVLLLGKSGQVGWELARALEPISEVTSLGREDVDLSSPQALRAAIRGCRPEWVVNAAAYTQVDKAESEPEMTFAVNSNALEVIAEEARSLSAAVIHFSTDYVFDGKKSEPYREDDVASPLNVYGESKLGGEQALAAAGIPFAVLRTSWIYGWRGTNFLRTILRLAEDRDELRIVNDQFGAPTWCRDAAYAAMGLMEAVDFDPERLSESSGVYHATAAGETSWFGFAQAIMAEAGKCDVKLVGISSDQYATIARRPRNSRLNCKKIADVFGIRLPEWAASLGTMLREHTRSLMV